MKKITKVIFLSTLLCSLSIAQNSQKFRIDELALLPHPNKIFKSNPDKFNFTDEQKAKMKQIQQGIAQNFHAKMNQAFNIEKQIQKAVNKGKNAQELGAKIEELSILKKEALEARIDALSQMQRVVGKENWDKMLEIYNKGK